MSIESEYKQANQQERDREGKDFELMTGKKSANQDELEQKLQTDFPKEGLIDNTNNHEYVAMMCQKQVDNIYGALTTVCTSNDQIEKILKSIPSEIKVEKKQFPDKSVEKTEENRSIFDVEPFKDEQKESPNLKEGENGSAVIAKARKFDTNNDQKPLPGHLEIGETKSRVTEHGNFNKERRAAQNNINNINNNSVASKDKIMRGIKQMDIEIYEESNSSEELNCIGLKDQMREFQGVAAFKKKKMRKCHNKYCQNVGSMAANLKLTRVKINKNYEFLCGTCLEAYKEGKYCLYCEQIYFDHSCLDGKEYVQCESCLRWVHIECEELNGGCSKGGLAHFNNSVYICPICKRGNKKAGKEVLSEGKNWI